MNNSEFRLKRIQTDIKSAQGSMAMALLLTLIYIVRAVISKNLNFYFSLYTAEFLIKFSDFAPGCRGSLPKPAAAVLIAVFIVAALIFTVLSQKKPAFLYGCLALYGFDTVFMLLGKLTGFFSPFVQEDFIDIVVHAFILTFLIIGVIGYKKLKNPDVSEVKEGENNG